MARRLELDSKLRSLLGSTNTYFQPPESIKLRYPCIVYHLNTVEQKYADNKTYRATDMYDAVYITDDPDDDFRERMLDEFEYIRFNTTYRADNLNHYSFTIYY